ncbi:alanine racemase [Candidatus Merdisoma sp. HCP28S3_D10]|uniref:alanine racemase n=1 Tax=unclassified Candidatus Merdisoma TaxID=3099611 RepID=UPI003F8C3C5C
MKNYKRVAAYVDLDAIEDNFEAMKANLKENTRIAAVVKANGYGHGAVPIARMIEDKDYLWGFAAATIEEAVELRKNGICKPILILGYVFPEDYPELVRLDIRPTVFRLDMARELSEEAIRQGKEVRVHIKLDTGMSRIGFADTEESVKMVCEIGKLPGIILEGLFTHFSKSDETDKTATEKQLARYRAFCAACEAAGAKFQIHHCSNSAGIIDLPEANLDMVRAGITVYGLYPSDEVKKELVPLRPAMEMKSHIVHVKKIAPGTEVSYGGIYTAESTRKIATVPVGYADGYPRSLSNKGCVLVAGKRAPICGRVCMDQMMVDVTEIPEAVPGMEVTIFGKDGEEFLSVDELAELSGRFNYEFVCDLSQRVPRIYLRHGKICEIHDFYA